MGLIARLQELKRPKSPAQRKQALIKTLQRNKRWSDLLLSRLDVLSLVLLLLGCVYLLVIPVELLHRNARVSENALQPGQVSTYWNWADVKAADKFDPLVRQWATLHHLERAAQIQNAFQEAGLQSAVQSYTYIESNVTSEPAQGTNAYAFMRAPKTDGAEAIVLAASWNSRAGPENPSNIRGIAVLLAMAKHAQKLSVWSKDIIFLVSDGYTSGAHAWVNAYHEVEQSNLVSEPLKTKTGSIWAALHVDYPYHSFSHLGIYFESLNGLLPNIDFINSVSHIARWTGGSPVRLHNVPDEIRADRHSGILSKALDHPFVKDYELSAQNIWQQVSLASVGSPSGPEGVYGRFRIDAISIFAVPADGPHGFFSIGKTIESTLRTLNNLIERFHASVFLYLMSSPRKWVALPNYLAAPVLVGVALNIKGLAIWASLFKSADGQQRARRPVVASGAIIVFTQVFGYLAFESFSTASASFKPVVSIFILFSTLLIGYSVATILPQSTFSTLKAFNLILAGMVVCVIAVLNFSLATLIGILLGLPLIILQPGRLLRSAAHTAILLASSPAGLYLICRAFAPAQMAALTRDWEMLGGYFLPVLFLVVFPLQMQGIVLAWLP